MKDSKANSSHPMLIWVMGHSTAGKSTLATSGLLHGVVHDIDSARTYIDHKLKPLRRAADWRNHNALWFPAAIGGLSSMVQLQEVEPHETVFVMDHGPWIPFDMGLIPMISAFVYLDTLPKEEVERRFVERRRQAGKPVDQKDIDIAVASRDATMNSCRMFASRKMPYFFLRQETFKGQQVGCLFFASASGIDVCVDMDISDDWQAVLLNSLASGLDIEGPDFISKCADLAEGKK